MNNQSLIQSGRTTRMLEKAKEIASTGKKVVVVAANLDHCWWFETYKLPDYRELGIAFVSAPSMPASFWATGKCDLCAKDAVFLVDHYAIEMNLSFALKELHAYYK